MLAKYEISRLAGGFLTLKHTLLTNWILKIILSIGFVTSSFPLSTPCFIIHTIYHKSKVQQWKKNSSRTWLLSTKSRGRNVVLDSRMLMGRYSKIKYCKKQKQKSCTLKLIPKATKWGASMENVADSLLLVELADQTMAVFPFPFPLMNM